MKSVCCGENIYTLIPVICYTENFVEAAFVVPGFNCIVKPQCKEVNLKFYWSSFNSAGVFSGYNETEKCVI